MKEHLIKKNSKNKLLIISHRIILGVLFVILIYEVIFHYDKNKYNFLSFNQINLYLNILYYFLCFLREFNNKDTKKAYQLFFHFCFSLSASLPIIYLVNKFINFKNEIKTEKETEKIAENESPYMSIIMLISPIILNFLETLIIKRYRPAYINPFFLVLFIILYYSLIHLLGKIGMDIGDFKSKHLVEIKFVIILCVSTLIGIFIGWWLYKFLTKPKAKKINIEDNSSVSVSELSEE
jgi:hypothetical protein